MVQTMAHTCYRVADLEKSIKFYTEAFDFKVSRERDFKEYKFTLVYLTLPGFDYELELSLIHILRSFYTNDIRFLQQFNNDRND